MKHMRRIPLEDQLDRLNAGHTVHIEYAIELLLKLSEMNLEAYYDPDPSTYGLDFLTSELPLEPWEKGNCPYTVGDIATVIGGREQDPHIWRKTMAEVFCWPMEDRANWSQKRHTFMEYEDEFEIIRAEEGGTFDE